MARSKDYYNYIYSQEWKEKSQMFRRFFFNRCVLFPWLKAKHTHHLNYKRFKKELFWFDCLPLSESAHALMHLPFLWKNLPLRLAVNFYLRIAAIVLLPFVLLGIVSFSLGDIICLIICPQWFIGKKVKKKIQKKQQKKLRGKN